MATVSGITADALNQLLGEEVISASIASNNRLYLKTRSGVVIDAGFMSTLDDFIRRLERLELGTDEGVWHYIESETGEPIFNKANSNAVYGNYGDPWQSVRYRKDHGFVTVEGLMRPYNGGGVTPWNMFQLPEGFRPPNSIMFPVNTNFETGAASTGTAHTHTLTSTAARLTVSPAGVFTLTQQGNMLSTDHLSLSGVQYDTR